ncbi:sensor histidine kinase [Candidatus Darwinibacter acetoxidans]|jgi:two-component system sensor histidine kinase ArlS|nr:ATP-binding protein [Bacillota bacterium]
MKNKQEKVHTIGFSLVSKLNIQLWFRLVGTFLMLNVVFIVASGITLAVLGERQAVQAVRHVENYGLPSAEESTWLFNQGLEVKEQEPAAAGYIIPIPPQLQRIFPQETRAAQRTILLPHDENAPLYNILDDLQYQLDVEVLGTPISVVIHFGIAVWVLKTVFLVLLIWQLVTAIRTMVSRAELIRRVLRPISDLAQQTQTLSQGQGPLSIEEMQTLAGTLDEINAARLDTRIDLDTTQDELKNLAVAINGLLDRMRESYRLQARFVSDASHELRTPIAAIQGYVNLLDRWGKNDPEALQESIDALKEEAANMKELVEKLLFLARGDNHTMQINLEHFDLGKLAETMYRETEMIDGGHEFSLETEPAPVLADQGLVKQAGRILIDNAIKYTPVGGRIRIVVSCREDKVMFTVQDSGIGIAPEDIPHIFDRFYRADDSRARATGGTGLGLSIAKWVAERHGGYLEVFSRENFGTRISLVLPRSESS